MGTAWFANEGILTMLFDVDDESGPRERMAHLGKAYARPSPDGPFARLGGGP